MVVTRQTDLTKRIRFHYNSLAPVYYGLWGEHIHHGYWEDAADSAHRFVAQQRLIAELYAFAGTPRVQHLADIGCGYGGTLAWFAHRCVASGVGLTISPAQSIIARWNLKRRHLAHRVRVEVADAQGSWRIPDQSCDMVWSMETIEHLHDKAHVVREALRVLKPGGTLCLAVWLRGSNDQPSAATLRAHIERGMLCYPLNTIEELTVLLEITGFVAVRTKIITPHVTRTWDISIRLRDLPFLPQLSYLFGEDRLLFNTSFDMMLDAYKSGAMDYAFIVGWKEG